MPCRTAAYAPIISSVPLSSHFYSTTFAFLAFILFCAHAQVCASIRSNTLRDHNNQIMSTPSNAPHAPTSAPPVSTAEASTSQHRASQPTSANTTEVSHGVQAPHDAPAPAPAAPDTPSPLTLNEKLNAADRYWKFKTGLYIVLILVGIIGIGCFGWIVATGQLSDTSYYNLYTSSSYSWPALITFTISIIWCAICILVFIGRKRAVHPGLRVSIELLLWLAYVVTILFAMLGLYSIIEIGQYGDIDGQSGYSSSSSGYRLADNNTWVWQQSSDPDYPSQPRTCYSSASSYSSSGDDAVCAAQDAEVNALWHSKPHRLHVMLTGLVCQYLGLLLHIALFIWACVDTHYYNRTKVSKDAEKLAAGIVKTMIENGAILPPPGQAFLRQQQQQQQMGHGAMGQPMYYQGPGQQPNGMYPMGMQTNGGQGMYMAPGQYPAGIPPPAASAMPMAPMAPIGEKGHGARYA